MASIIDHNGIERKLGLLPLDDATRNLAASKPSFGDYLAENNLPLYQEEDWEEVDPEFGDEFVLDQHQTSGCVGFSEAAAEMKIRALRGMPFETLSGAFSYSLVNGGRDGGAQIIAARDAAEQHGHALESEFHLPNIYWNQVPPSVRQSALERKSRISYRINSPAEAASAILEGFIVQAGVCVGGNFNSLTREGIAGYTRGYANHSIHLFGLKRINGEWCFKMGNTWSKNWAIRGNCWLHKYAPIWGDSFAHVDSERS